MAGQLEEKHRRKMAKIKRKLEKAKYSANKDHIPTTPTPTTIVTTSPIKRSLRKEMNMDEQTLFPTITTDSDRFVTMPTSPNTMPNLFDHHKRMDSIRKIPQRIKEPQQQQQHQHQHQQPQKHKISPQISHHSSSILLSPSKRFESLKSFKS